MKILVEALRAFTDLPADPREARNLLEDVGIEVRRASEEALGTVYTVELLANRGDHYSYAGIAREATGRTGGALRLPPGRELATGEPPVPIRVETDGCLVYTLTPFERVEGEAPPLPEHLLGPVRATESQATVGPVLASNLANLELGQPTHAFDADTIEGGITVRLSRAGERAHLLFTAEPTELPEGTLVIADDAKILAVAGVIGCEESKVTAESQRLLLESATFAPVPVRRASRALGLPTDAAARFMRGGDPTLPLPGAGRVAFLLEEHFGWRVSGPTGVRSGWTDPERVIPIEVESTADFVGFPFTQEEIRERLGRYGFTATPDPAAPGRLRVRVPPHRLWDVEFPADLHEELARSVGYDATDVRIPVAGQGALPTRDETIKARVDEVLAGAGFYEVFTPVFYSRAVREQLGIGEGHALWEHVETINAVDRDYSLLQNNSLIHAVEAVATNVSLRNPDVKAYEWTRTFHPDASAPNGVCAERPILWMVVNGRDRAPSWGEKGRPADPYFLKGVLEEIGTALRLDFTLGSAEGHPLADRLHPNRSAGIYLGGRRVGVLGEVHPSVVERFRIKRARPCYLEVERPALLAEPGPRVFVPPPAAQPVARNLAFTLPPRVEAGEVAEALRAHGPAWLARVDVVDLFELEADGVPLRAVTFALEYSAEEAGTQLTTEVVNGATEAAAAGVLERLGHRGVSMRSEG